MQKKVLSFMMIIFLFVLCVQGLSAQEKKMKSQLFAVWDDIVLPSKIMKYEAATKKLLDFYTKHKSPYSVDIYKTNDNHYYWLTPIKNMADLDTMFKFFSELEKKAGKEAKKLDKQFAGTLESTTFGTLSLRYDLSYNPEKPRVKQEDANFLWWNYYYIISGKTKEAEKIAKEYKALYKKHNIGDGFNIYIAGMWSDLPVLVAAGRAKSNSDFYLQAEKNIKIFGDQYMILAKKSMAICRKYEEKTGYYLKKLSYHPPKVKKAKKGK